MAKKTSEPIQEDTVLTATDIPDAGAVKENFPYEAVVTVPLLVVRKGAHPIPSDKPVGTLAKGTRVTVAAIMEGYAMLSNGTYVKAAFLERLASGKV